MQIKGFHAWVLVDGIELNQYGVETSSEGDKVTCWIPSEAGKARWLSHILTNVGSPCVFIQKFTVKWRDSSRHREVTTAGYVYLDGIKCGGRFIKKSTESRIDIAERSSAATSLNTERPYVFSPIEFTGTYSTYRKEIQLTVHRCQTMMMLRPIITTKLLEIYPYISGELRRERQKVLLQQSFQTIRK